MVKIYAKKDADPHEYFLIENRRQVGADRRAPGEGLLIWQIDDSRTSFRRSLDVVEHKRVDLLTADSWPSHLDLGHRRGGNRGDDGDPFRDRDLAVGPDTKPGTGTYDGTRGRFKVRNVSPAASTMTFDVEFENASDDAAGTN